MNYKKIFNVVGVVAVAVVFSVGCGEDPPPDYSDDPNDGKGDDSYSYSGGVKIGNQTWMAKNLDRKTINSKCYENSEEYCLKYGRMYTWTDAVKACPAGWHLPNDAEWTELITAVGGESIAGKKLKATSGWGDSWNGTDDYGFSALPGGTQWASMEFLGAEEYGYWWSATEVRRAEYEVWRTVGMVGVGLSDDMYLGEDGFGVDKSVKSVRCVQD
jgi:uncharacterized protein (TIGR02145 family)